MAWTKSARCSLPSKTASSVQVCLSRQGSDVGKDGSVTCPPVKGEEGDSATSVEISPAFLTSLILGNFVTTSATPSGGLVRSSPKMAETKIRLGFIIRLPRLMSGDMVFVENKTTDQLCRWLGGAHVLCFQCGLPVLGWFGRPKSRDPHGMATGLHLTWLRWTSAVCMGWITNCRGEGWVKGQKSWKTTFE